MTPTEQDMTMQPANGEPRVVDAGRGAAWWGKGVRLFTAAAWPWIGITLVYIILSGMMNAIPIVGGFGQWLLTPVFMGGLMIGCQSIDRTGTLQFAHLFEGFQGERFVPLMIIGAVNIGLLLGIFAIVATGVFGFLQIAGLLAAADPSVAIEMALQNVTGAGLIATLVILTIVLVVAMLNWFAPALVALRGATAIQAMKLSFLACLRNWLPFLVYGAIGIAVLIGALLAIVLIFVAIGAAALMSGISITDFDALVAAFAGAFIGAILLVLLIVVVGMVVLGPIIFGTTYAGYKDIFDPDDESTANPAYPDVR